MCCYTCLSGGEFIASYSDTVDVDMSSNRWKYFRWTPRTAWISFVYIVAVPSVVGYVGYVTDVRPSPLELASYPGSGLAEMLETRKRAGIHCAYTSIFVGQIRV